MKDMRKHSFIWDLAFIVCGIAALIFLFWKCNKGFANMDESFYLSIPLRLCQGDGLFAQEWHLSQMAGFLLYPIVKIYLMIFNSTEGIFLAFRYIYTAVNAIAAVFIYFRFRKMSRPGAFFAALCFMIYAPFGIMALSYNSMGIICLALSLTIMATSERIVWLQHIFAGLFFAAAVLCNPYLIVVYAIFTAAFIICAIVRKAKGLKKVENSIFCFKSWLFFTIGAALLAVVFAAFVLSRASISQILAAFPEIMDDPSHESKGAIGLIVSYFTSIIGISKKAVLCYVLTAITAIIALIDKKRSKHAVIYFAAGFIFTAVAMIFTVKYGNYINYVMFPLNILTLVCVVIGWSENIKRLFFVFYIPAMVYTLCMHASSNMEFYAISSGAAVAVVSSLMIIALSAEKIFKESKNVLRWLAFALAGVVMAGQLVTLTLMRYNAVFWGSMDILESTAQSEGTEKGLYVPASADEEYALTLKICDYIETNYPGEQNLAILSDYIWLYLECPEKNISVFSGWLAEVGDMIRQNNIDKLMEYYRLNPEKIPDIIYMEKDYPDFIDDFQQLADYDVEVLELNNAYILSRVK